MRTAFQWLAVVSVGGLAWVASGCESSRPGSLHATVSIVDSEDSCAFDSPPGTSCTITRTLSVLIQEDAGRDVHLESVSGVLWDIRGMQDVHAVLAMLSSSDIRAAVGTSVVPAYGQLSLPYKLGFTLVRPYLPFSLTVKVNVLVPLLPSVVPTSLIEKAGVYSGMALMLSRPPVTVLPASEAVGVARAESTTALRKVWAETPGCVAAYSAMAPVT